MTTSEKAQLEATYRGKNTWLLMSKQGGAKTKHQSH